MNAKPPNLETKSDEEILEKEIKKDIETQKQSTKLLTGYPIFDKKENKEIIREYSKIYEFNKYALKHLSKDLENAYHLRYNKNNDKVYLFDYDSQSYLELNDRILQEYLNKKEDIRLDTTEAGNLIKSTVKTIKNNYNYIEFNNKLFNLKTYELEDKTIKKEVEGKEYGTNKPRPFIVPKRINHDILSTKNKDFNPEKSIVYKTLKQILSTEDNIKDFKQRLGLSIFNTGKEITIYYAPSGNNGKSLLLKIRQYALGNLVLSTDPNQLKSDYKQNLLNGIHEHQFDEPAKDSFKSVEHMMKKMTGGGTKDKTRKIQSQELIETIIKSHIVIATNPLPDINLNDEAYLKRISIIELFNTFVSDDSLVDNEKAFPIDDNIEEKLQEDTEGLSHLLYEAIKEVILMKDLNQELVNKKGVEYVRAFYLGNDHLSNFLSVYTEFTEYETELTTATEIFNNYKQYLKDNNIDLIVEDTEVKIIGTKLNSLYGKDRIIRKRDTDEKKQLRYKNIKCNYTTEKQKGFFINQKLEDYEIYDENNRKIFNLIKEGYNTFEILKQQVKHHNDIITALKYLKDNGYIKERTILKTK